MSSDQQHIRLSARQYAHYQRLSIDERADDKYVASRILMEVCGAYSVHWDAAKESRPTDTAELSSMRFSLADTAHIRSFVDDLRENECGDSQGRVGLIVDFGFNDDGDDDTDDADTIYIYLGVPPADAHRHYSQLFGSSGVAPMD